MSRVNPNGMTGLLPYDVGQNRKNGAERYENTPEKTQPDVAIKVEISAEARKKTFELKEHGSGSSLKLDETFFSKEAREQRKLDFAKKLAEPVEIDPFDNEFQILGVTYTFNDGTLEKFITDGLDGKVKNASLVAAELGQMIRGTISNPDGSVEERAVNRETALQHASYLAENYFDNPDEAKAFLDGINRFAENDVLREKGYIVLDNSDLAPFKAYQSSVNTDGGISWNAYAKEYGLSNAKDIFSDAKTLNSFYMALQKNNSKWDERLAERFEENENRVADIIGKVKDSLSEDDVAKSLQRLMKAF